MPIAVGDPTNITRMESIARVELFTDAKRNPDDWEVVVHFETGNYDEKGVLVGDTVFGSTRVARRFGDIKGEKGVVEIVDTIKTLAYQWHTENANASRKLEDERSKAEQE